MNTKEYTQIIELEHQQGLFKPVNQRAIDFCSNLKHKERVYLIDKSKRDIKFHKTYFALLNYIYSWMPEKFKLRITEDLFYIFLKDITGEFKVKFKFKDGKEIKEYNSIAFGKMSQKSFEEYVKNQLPLIYDNLIYELFDTEKAKMIIENIEDEFKIYLSKL